MLFWVPHPTVSASTARRRAPLSSLLTPMPRTIYCWRCRTDLPMLTEDEWALVQPQLANAIEQIKQYRQEYQCSLAEAKANGFGQSS